MRPAGLRWKGGGTLLTCIVRRVRMAHENSLILKFLGAAGTVAGSRTLLRSGTDQLLVHCDMFQGLKNLRKRNWARFPVNPADIAAVLLTHAHLDHSGYLPRLARMGFTGPIYGTAATVELARILLLDSAGIQEADAEFMNRHQLTSHSPSLPLYTVKDAEYVLKQFRPVELDQWLEVMPGWRAR